LNDWRDVVRIQRQLSPGILLNTAHSAKASGTGRNSRRLQLLSQETGIGTMVTVPAKKLGQFVGYPSGADVSGFRLDSDTVIHRRCNPLGAAEISLGGLDGNVPKKKLNLLQFAVGGAAEPSATSTKIVGREFANANLGGELLDDMPDQLFRHSLPQTLPALLTRRKRLPALIPAAVVQSFNSPVTQSGTGMVRT
jgi:hypothetical protein